MDGELTAAELTDLLVEAEDGEAEAPMVVDVRDGDAFARRHIPGAEHVPFAEIPRHSDRIAQADHVVTVCYEGIASAKAARLVASHKDFDGVVENLAGGMEAWDGPVDSDLDDAETEASDPPF